MAGVPDVNRNEPGKRPTQEQPNVEGTREETEHRRVERAADNAARRAGERMRQDEAGNDEFSNIGPV